MARLTNIMFVTVFGALMVPAPASAQRAGSAGLQTKVPLAAVLALAQPYPNLRQEVRLALIETGANKNTATCIAGQLGDEWVALKTRAVGPYRCKLGKRTLVIKTATTFFDAAGHKIAADDAKLPARAARVAEARLVWSWQ